MSKYNNIKSIPVSSIPKNEIKQAIKEWAEGNSHLENLLWACLNNNIETTGCHVGKNSYLGIIVNDSHDKVKKMLHKAQEFDRATVQVSPDGGNPKSGSDWYKPNLTFSFPVTNEKFANNIFDSMSESLTDESTKYKTKDKAFEHILDFYDFFTGKESNCDFRISHDLGQYTFSIDSFKEEKNLDYFASLFEKSGLNRMKKDPIDSPVDSWTINASTPEEFNEKMIKCKDIIMREWSLELPCEITKGMSFNTKAHIKKREFGETPEGIQQFEKWLQEENDRIEKLIQQSTKCNFMASLKDQVNDNPTYNNTSSSEKEKTNEKQK